MNFKKIITKKNKFLLPVSWLYQLGISVFNALYNSGLKKSTLFHIPIICVGNLSVGGTGKSPMVEYLIQLLQPYYTLAIVSRGYKRMTKGLIIADASTTANEIGDEPMQFHHKFPQVTIAVSEKRATGIEKVIADKVADVIILDDAFQHRAVTAGMNMLLAEYNNLFVNDYYLPAGQLRDLKSSYKRAQVIIVTKCPPTLSIAEKENIIGQIKPFANQFVYFTAIRYEAPYHLFTKTIFNWEQMEQAIVLTGIANPQPLLQFIAGHAGEVHTLSFPDHHQFINSDIQLLIKRFNDIPTQKKIILTTEKDSMRLIQYKNILPELPIYVVPVAHDFLFDQAPEFNQMIAGFINSFTAKNDTHD